MQGTSKARRASVLVWQWGQRGAGPRFAAEIASALQACDADVVLSLSRNAEAYRELSTLCRKSLPFEGRAQGGSGLRVLLDLPGQLRKLRRALRADPPGSAICAMMGYWDIPFALLLRAMGIKVLSVVHEVKGHPGDSHSKLYLLQRLMVRLSSEVVTLSDYVATEVKARWPGKTVVEAFHPPFAFSDLDLPPPSALMPRQGPLRLLVAGRLWAYKGVTLALAALERLPEGSASLRIVGSGAAVLPDAGSRQAVTFEGRWLSERDLVGEIDAAQVVLFPYIEASQSGLVPLCLSRGRPAIVTDVGGLPDQLRDEVEGLVVHPQAEDIATAIGRFLGDPAFLADLSAKALRDNDPKERWRALAKRLMPALAAR